MILLSLKIDRQKILIHKSMFKKWKEEGRNDQELSDLWNDYVPKHLLPRIYGFELMMAPYPLNCRPIQE